MKQLPISEHTVHIHQLHWHNQCIMLIFFRRSYSKEKNGKIITVNKWLIMEKFHGTLWSNHVRIIGQMS